MSEHEIFAAAIRLTGTARGEFLSQTCGGDERLRQQVEALLKAHEESGGIVPRQMGRDLDPTMIPRDVVPQQHVQPGTVIGGRYKLIEAIGEGGMGAVWLAEQKEPVKRRVAVKLVKPGMDSVQVLARFEAERQALALMDHPNIARVFDGGMTDQGRPYFVMELVRGIPVTDYCDQCQYTVRERLELFGQVCSAVQHAHQKGIIHRDIKPSNILVTEYDGKPICKVIDFGLAKAIQGGHTLTEASMHTAFGAVLGTPLYMAPEQLGTSALDVDTRADLYSLGVILYELLTGTTPIERQRIKQAAWDEMQRMLRDEEPPIPSLRLSASATLPSVAARRHEEPARLARMLRGDLDWIIMKSLEKDRNRRYETANGLAQDIHRHLVGEAVLAAPPSSVYRFRKFIRKNRGPVVAAGLVFLTLIGGIVGTSYGLYRASRSAIGERQARLDAQRKQHEAEQQRLRAEEREEEAINAMRQFGDIVAANAELRNAPDLEALRSSLLQKPLSFFQSLRDRLEADSGTSDVSLARLGRAAWDLGNLTDAIGNKEDAIRAYQHAIEIYGRLAETDPASYRHGLATCHSSMGMTLRAAGQREKALEAHKTALSILEQFDATTRTVEIDSDIAMNYANIGAILMDIREFDEARAVHEKALEIREKLAKENPGQSRFQFDLAISRTDLGILFRANGKVPESIEALRHSLGILQKLPEAQFMATDVQARIAENHANIGANLAALGRTGDALESHKLALEIRQRLSDQSPTATRYLADLAATRGDLGIVFASKQMWTEALEQENLALGILETLTRKYPAVTAYQIDTANCLSRIGAALTGAGNLEASLKAHHRALEIRKRLAEIFPSNTEFRNLVAVSYTVIGITLNRLGKGAEALDAHKCSFEIRKRLTEDNPIEAYYHDSLEQSFVQILGLQESVGNFRELLEFLNQEIASNEAMVVDEPANESYQRLLGMAHHWLGVVRRDMNEMEGARHSFERAADIYERLSRANPRSLPHHAKAITSLAALARLELAADREVDAHERLESAIGHLMSVINDDTHTTHLTSLTFLRNELTSLRTTASFLSKQELRDGIQLQLNTIARKFIESAKAHPALAVTDSRLSGVLQGAAANGTEERLSLGIHAYRVFRFQLATRLYSEALDIDSTVAESRRTEHAYNAACCAALAASDQSLDEAELSEEAKSKLRQQARLWLEADLRRWEHSLEAESPEQLLVAQKLAHWRRDPDLASLRSAESLALLPEAERSDLENLWKHVERCRVNAVAPGAATSTSDSEGVKP